jgi:predicted nucleotidyltransferase component of viral defense system
LAQSVQVRLLQHAKTLSLDPNLVLTRFAAERFLYRLSVSTLADRFVLKGAMLMLVWLGETIRPTRDVDLLGFGDLSAEALTTAFVRICSIEVEPDGLTYDTSSVHVTAIRAEDAYGGQRIGLEARLGHARLVLQFDVGIGDAVIPPPEWIDYPSLLGFPHPHLRAYRPETAIAEKVHAMVMLGSRNSRMRDFFDIYALAERESFDGRVLAHSLRATFEARQTPIPNGVPLALTEPFAISREKAMQWSAFRRKSGLAAAPEQFTKVVELLSRFLWPVLDCAGQQAGLQATWAPGGPWRPHGDAL